MEKNLSFGKIRMGHPVETKLEMVYLRKIIPEMDVQEIKELLRRAPVGQSFTTSLDGNWTLDRFLKELVQCQQPGLSGAYVSWENIMNLYKRFRQ